MTPNLPPIDQPGTLLPDHVFHFEGRNIVIPSQWWCPCGQLVLTREKCPNIERHEAIRKLVRIKFEAGMRVFYNRWAYPINDPGTVTGYPRKLDETNWHWVRVHFERLKTPRNIPILSHKGWHLSVDPLSGEDHEWLSSPFI